MADIIEISSAVGEQVTLPCDAVEPVKHTANDQFMLEWMFNDEIIYTKFSATRDGEMAVNFAGVFSGITFTMFSCGRNYYFGKLIRISYRVLLCFSSEFLIDFYCSVYFFCILSK
jgi:hypothetical protein